MKESTVKNIEFKTSEWSSTKIDSTDSISGDGILVDGQDGVLIVEGEPVQEVSKKSGNWVRSEGTNLSPNVLREPKIPEMLRLLVCKTSERSLVSDIYSNETSIDRTDQKLRESLFTGYIEVSKDTISGEHYLIYINGERCCLSITKGGNRITGQKSYDRAETHVGLYSIYEIELQDVSVNRTQSESKEKTTEEHHKKEDESTENTSAEQTEEDVETPKDKESDKEYVEPDTDSQIPHIPDNKLRRIENKLDDIQSKVDKLSNVTGTREEKLQGADDYDITNEYDESEIFNNTVLGFRYGNFSKKLSECETEDEVKDVLENIDIIPQTTELVSSDVTDADVENYILQHKKFATIKWLLEEYLTSLMNDETPNLPGFVSMMQNLEQVSYNDTFESKLYDALFYSRDGEVRGVIEFYDEQVDVRQIDDSISKLSSSIDDLEEPFCYIGISRNGYSPDIRNYIEEERYKGGLIRGENRSALIKSDDGTEIHTCLFEEHNEDFFAYYPDVKENS